jgi:aryl-alcohol dehydrogenase-like predicted oxidoreductase
MHFGVPIEDDRLTDLLAPGDGVDTVITADVYGAGEADTLVGRALDGVDRDAISVVGAVGHDFYEGERQGPKGFPRFTDPALRGPDGYADYLKRATEASLERLGVDRLDLLLLHNPDGMAALRDAGLTDAIGVAPGPANGFTLDLLDCFERFGDRLDWAMVILNPLEPWPGSLVLDAAASHGIDVITRVVDYGGLFHDDIRTEEDFPERDHRRFRAAGWVDRGLHKLEEMRPIAERHDLTLLQLACAWNLAHAAVACVVPTLIQEAGDDAKAIELKRLELGGVAGESPLNGSEIAAIRAIGDNTGCMVLKGAAPDHEGPAAPDRWALDAELEAIGRRWGIDARRDLVMSNG